VINPGKSCRHCYYVPTWRKRHLRIAAFRASPACLPFRPRQPPRIELWQLSRPRKPPAARSARVQHRPSPPVPCRAAALRCVALPARPTVLPRLRERTPHISWPHRRDCPHAHTCASPAIRPCALSCLGSLRCNVPAPAPAPAPSPAWTAGRATTTPMASAATLEDPGREHHGARLPPPAQAPPRLACRAPSASMTNAAASPRAASPRSTNRASCRSRTSPTYASLRTPATLNRRLRPPRCRRTRRAASS
jgi:hypothetical protein